VALVVGSGPYSWFQAVLGVLCVVVGGILAADFNDAATTLRNRRAKWGRLLAGPTWLWRALGAFMAVNGVMLLVQ
jgi:hypothetical protein